MTRRYYRMRRARAVRRARASTGIAVAHADYEQDGRRRHVVATFAELDALDGALRASPSTPRRCPTASRSPSTSTPDGGRARDALAAELRARVAAVALPAEVERVVVGIATRRAAADVGRRRCSRFRRRDGPVEDERPARPAPDDGRAAGALAPVELRPRAPARRPRTSTCSTASARENPARRAPVRASPRCAT